MTRPIDRDESPDRHAHRRGTWRPGFTMTELLIALFLATVGMVTVFGIQVAANLVQRQARDINAARMLGDSFITRLRGETVNWTSLYLPQDCTQADMPLCWWALYGARGGEGVWVAAPSVDFGNDSPRYNSLGIPEDTVDATITDRMRQHNLRYCIQYNLNSHVGELVIPNELMRVQVRVFWPITTDAFSDPPVGVSDCGYSNPQDMVDATVRGQFRFMQLNSMLYRHQERI